MHDFRHAANAQLSSQTDDPDIRILRRVSTLQDFPLALRDGGPIQRVAIVDVETTGTDPQIDEIIDIAVVIVEVNTAGEIVGIKSSAEAMRDPGMPIPPHISQLTGITDADVRGKTIDLDRLQRRLETVEVLIGHNCAFDSAFIESLLPGIAGAAWACSANDFDWLGAGFDGRKLQHLLMQIGRFAEAHRAMADVIALIHLLSHSLPNGRTVLCELLANAAKTTVRIEATGAPFQMRGLLKARGYRWDARVRAWWAEIAPDEEEVETLWLQREITPYGPPPRTRPINWHQRHR